MTTHNTYTLGRVIPAQGTGYSQLPALFNDSWFTDVLKDFDKAFDVPNAVYPYNIKVTTRKTNSDEPLNYIIEVALAGVGKDHIRINVKEGHLNIIVDKEEEIEESEVSYVRKGISRRKGNLSFTLKDNADIKKISSNYSDGLLRVFVPVKQPEVYNIDVKVN
ncbi:MAG: Hsp20/alpha crystallin family protein [Alphaproteobacteria bacterium]|nr:Hsp20/alpha crystallin family protein [Alphaproteobacteria bacterium]